MFDGNCEHDVDLRRSSLPLSVGHHAITRSSVSSAQSPSPRPTALSRGRAASSDLKKESSPATLKEIDELKLTIRKLETKVNTLESRVQYVNPWAVQHMWDVLLKLQERVGIDEPSTTAVAVATSSAASGRGGSYSPSKGRDGFDASSPEATDVFRACSPLTPSGPLSATFEVSSLFPTRGTAWSNAPAHIGLRWLEFEESIGRQQLLLEQSTVCNRVMATYLPTAVAALSSMQTRGDGIWDCVVPRGGSVQALGARWQHGSEYSGGADDELLPGPHRSTQRRQQQEPLPRLRGNFIEALITDKTFDERLKYLLADFVHPLLEASQKRFVSEAERWMLTHTNNLEHEFHDHMKSMSEARDAVTSTIEERMEATQSAVQLLVSEARHTVTDHVTMVNRLRDDVMESSHAVGLKIQRLDMFQTELMRSVNEALDIRLGALRAALERIGEQQDLLHRRMDDIQTRELMMKDVNGVADEGGDSYSTTATAQQPWGQLLQQAVAYLDGMQLAPSWEVPAAAEEEHTENRLDDSVVLQEFHNVLHRIWQHVTSRGSATGQRQIPNTSTTRVRSGSCSTSGPIALGFSDLVLRPTSIFPIHLIVRVVSPLLLRHSRASLVSECTRMKVPQHVSRGLEAGWEWLTSLAMGVVLRRSLQGEEAWMGVEEDEGTQMPLSIRTHGPKSRNASRSPSIGSDANYPPGQPVSLEMLATKGVQTHRHETADATHHHQQRSAGPAQSGTSFYTTTLKGTKGPCKSTVTERHQRSDRKSHLMASDTDFSHLYVGSSSNTHQDRPHPHQENHRSLSGLVASSSRTRPHEGASGGSSRSSSRAPSPGVHRQLAFR